MGISESKKRELFSKGSENFVETIQSAMDLTPYKKTPQYKEFVKEAETLKASPNYKEMTKQQRSDALGKIKAARIEAKKKYEATKQQENTQKAKVTLLNLTETFNAPNKTDRQKLQSLMAQQDKGVPSKEPQKNRIFDDKTLEKMTAEEQAEMVKMFQIHLAAIQDSLNNPPVGKEASSDSGLSSYYLLDSFVYTAYTRPMIYGSSTGVGDAYSEAGGLIVGAAIVAAVVAGTLYTVAQAYKVTDELIHGENIKSNALKATGLFGMAALTGTFIGLGIAATIASGPFAPVTAAVFAAGTILMVGGTTGLTLGIGNAIERHGFTHHDDRTELSKDEEAALKEKGYNVDVVKAVLLELHHKYTSNTNANTLTPWGKDSQAKAEMRKLIRDIKAGDIPMDDKGNLKLGHKVYPVMSRETLRAKPDQGLSMGEKLKIKGKGFEPDVVEQVIIKLKQKLDDTSDTKGQSQIRSQIQQLKNGDFPKENTDKKGRIDIDGTKYKVLSDTGMKMKRAAQTPEKAEQPDAEHSGNLRYE